PSARRTTTATATQPKTLFATVRPIASPATNAHPTRRSCRRRATDSRVTTRSRRQPRSLQSDYDSLRPCQSPNPLAPAPAMHDAPPSRSATAATHRAIQTMTAPCNPAAAPLNTGATRRSRSPRPPHNQPTHAVRPRPHAPRRRLRAPPRAAATPSRSRPTRSGARAPSPVRRYARKKPVDHQLASAPGRPSGTTAFLQHRTDPAQIALPSAQPGGDNRAPVLRRLHTTPQALQPAPAAATHPAHTPSRWLS